MKKHNNNPKNINAYDSPNSTSIYHNSRAMSDLHLLYDINITDRYEPSPINLNNASGKTTKSFNKEDEPLKSSSRPFLNCESPHSKTNLVGSYSQDRSIIKPEPCVSTNRAMKLEIIPEMHADKEDNHPTSSVFGNTNNNKSGLVTMEYHTDPGENKINCITNHTHTSIINNTPMKKYDTTSNDGRSCGNGNNGVIIPKLKSLNNNTRGREGERSEILYKKSKSGGNLNLNSSLNPSQNPSASQTRNSSSNPSLNPTLNLNPNLNGIHNPSAQIKKSSSLVSFMKNIMKKNSSEDAASLIQKKKLGFRDLLYLMKIKKPKADNNLYPLNRTQLYILQDKSSNQVIDIAKLANTLKKKSHVFLHLKPIQIDERGCFKKFIDFFKHKPINSQKPGHSCYRLWKNNIAEKWERIKLIIKKKWKTMEFVIRPESNFNIFWDIITLLFINYQLIMIPIQISFEYSPPDKLTQFDFAVDIFFLVDMIRTFNTGYFDENGVVLDRKKIIINYLRGWFWIDLLSSFPYSWLDGEILSQDHVDHPSYPKSHLFSTVNIIKVIRFLRFMKILRLLRVLKLGKIFERFEGFAKVSMTLSGIIGFLKLSFFILYIAHWLGCLWHYIGINELDLEPDTWLTIYGIANEVWSIRYIASIYWAVTTMVTIGYGDIKPITNHEKILAIVAMIISCGVFAFVINRMNFLIEQIEYSGFIYRSKMRNFANQLKNRDINPSLLSKVKRYMEHYFAEQKSFSSEETKLLSLLSSGLKDELITQIYAQIISKIPFLMNNFSKSFLAGLTYVIKEFNCGPSENIWTEAIDDKSLYYIYTGEIRICLYRLNSEAKILTTGSHFGEIAFVTGLSRNAYAQSKEYTRLFKIPRQEFLDLLEKYPHDKEKFHMIKDNILLYDNYSDLQILCYSCKIPNHFIMNCPIFHYPKQKSRKINKYIETWENFYKNFKRKDRKATSNYSMKDLHQKVLLIHANYPDHCLNIDYGRSSTKKTTTKVKLSTSPKKPNNLDYPFRRKLAYIIARHFPMKNFKPEDYLPKNNMANISPNGNSASPKNEQKRSKKKRRRKAYEGDVDTIGIFEYYYPHNNIENVLNELASRKLISINNNNSSKKLISNNTRRESLLREKFEKEYESVISEFYRKDYDDSGDDEHSTSSNKLITLGNSKLESGSNSQRGIIKSARMNLENIELESNKKYPGKISRITDKNEFDKRDAVYFSKLDQSLQHVKIIEAKDQQNKSPNSEIYFRKIRMADINKDPQIEYNLAIKSNSVSKFAKIGRSNSECKSLLNDNQEFSSENKIDSSFSLPSARINPPLIYKNNKLTVYKHMIDKLIEAYGIHKIKAYIENV